jgi:plastocyanin
MRLARSLPPALALALALALAAPATAADGFMSVQNFQFAPRFVQIKPGEKVDFNFEGPSTHTATLRRGQTDSYDSGPTPPGAKAHRFRYAGRFALLCTIHPEMTATVQVGAPEALAPRLAGLRARAGAGQVKLVFRVSERSVVSAVIGHRRVSRVLSAGTRSLTVTKLRPGRRTATLSARDGWRNKSATARRSFRVR